MKNGQSQGIIKDADALLFGSTKKAQAHLPKDTEYRQAIALGNNVMINTKNVLFDAISVYALKTLKHQK